MSSNWDIISGILITFALVAGVIWFLWRTLKRTEDPPRLIFKWILTIAVLFLLIRFVGPAMGGGGGGAIYAVPAAAALGLILAIIWGRSIAGFIAKPFASLYDDGNVEPDPKPVYSIALAKRKRGDYLGAKNAVREQLMRFPADVEGQMLLAEIEAQDLHDLSAAEIIVERFIHQPGHSPVNIAYALNSMADWHLKFAQDREAAQACFQKIIDRLPDTEWAIRAAQRIAHLGSRDLLLGMDARRAIHVPHIEGDPGLDGGASVVKPVEEDGGQLAAKYVKHLDEFPHDSEVREKLAELYAEHYRRLDLAVDQFEQLIQFPNQPARQVVKWLNKLADLQVKYGGTYAAAREALQRIIDLYPQAGAANLAQNRIELLKLEFKGKEKSQAVTLGSYEDDLGLKAKLPHQL